MNSHFLFFTGVVTLMETCSEEPGWTLLTLDAAILATQQQGRDHRQIFKPVKMAKEMS